MADRPEGRDEKLIKLGLGGLVVQIGTAIAKDLAKDALQSVWRRYRRWREARDEQQRRRWHITEESRYSSWPDDDDEEWIVQSLRQPPPKK